MDKVDHIVIGAGVVGLAVARALAERGQECLILEAEGDFGTITSARNSEVIHAGIYYPKDSLKAKFCVEGKKQLYDFCQTHAVPYANCGKLIVASDDMGLDTLDAIAKKAAENGVNDLVFCDQTDIKKREPDLSVRGGLYSPSTGIIDSHSLMQTLLGLAEHNGAILSTQSRVLKVKPLAEGFEVMIDAGGEVFSLQCHGLINAAGLEAQNVARSIEGLEDKFIPQLHLCKGNYFSLSGSVPFSQLIYPVPAAGGLGVHLTLDMAGQARFGPDTEWVDQVDYAVDPKRHEVMIEAIAQYWPEIRKRELLPAYSGMRPKLKAQGEGDSDFQIDCADRHGMNGLINLFGIESPGLTSALALADYISCEQIRHLS